MASGTVKWFDVDKAYGFILPDDGSGDVFVHLSSVEGRALLKQGDRVTFEARPGRRAPEAHDVVLVA